MDKKQKNILSYIIWAVLLGLIIWPASRIFIQQQLMKIGFFQPKLEKPLEKEDVVEEAIQAPGVTKAIFVDDKNNEIDTESLKGKVVFINFWATWCPPCKAEMPSIQSLYDKFKGNDNIVFLLVEIDGDIDGAKSFMKDGGLNLPVVYKKSDIPEAWLSDAIPTTVMLDKAGNIAAQEKGMYDYSTKEVENFLKELINQ